MQDHKSYRAPFFFSIILLQIFPESSNVVTYLSTLSGIWKALASQV